MELKISPRTASLHDFRPVDLIFILFGGTYLILCAKHFAENSDTLYYLCIKESMGRSEMCKFCSNTVLAFYLEA